MWLVTGRIEREWPPSGLATSKGSKKEGPTELGSKGQHPHEYLPTEKEDRWTLRSKRHASLFSYRYNPTPPDSATIPCSHPSLTAPVYEAVFTSGSRGNQLSLHIKANFWSQVQEKVKWKTWWRSKVNFLAVKACSYIAHGSKNQKVDIGKQSQCTWKTMNHLADLGFGVRKSFSNGACPPHF